MLSDVIAKGQTYQVKQKRQAKTKSKAKFINYNPRSFEEAPLRHERKLSQCLSL